MPGKDDFTAFAHWPDVPPVAFAPHQRRRAEGRKTSAPVLGPSTAQVINMNEPHLIHPVKTLAQIAGHSVCLAG